MKLDARNILKLVEQGEGLTLEFKACRTALNRDVYESVCAFLNRHGGTILLGVNDSGGIDGVEEGAVFRIRKDFANALNNPQKISPVAYLSISEARVEGKVVLHVYVPESSQVHRCNGRIYDRNEDGDFDITDHTRRVAEMYHRKQATYSENKIYPHAGLDELERDLIARCRKIAVLRREDHPWGGMDDMELLKSAQLYQTDPETGTSGVTLAGLLLLGPRAPLLSAVPHHRTDLILRKVNLDRYDDRDFVTVNLVESYERIMAFVAKHLPDPFHLEGTISISLRDAIFREVASNILIHREYMNAFPAKLIIERGQVRTENSNKPHGFGTLNPETFTPFPKNPVIAGFFQQIGRADELGSGMRKMIKYGKSYGGADPELVEGDVFRITVKTPEFDAGTVEPVDSVEENLPPKAMEQRLESRLEMRLESPLAAKVVLKLSQESIGKTGLAAHLGHKSVSGELHKQIKRLLEMEYIEMTIPNKPTSRLQKYRLTEKGRKLLES